MNLLNRGLAQVTDLFHSMTPSARLTTGLLVALILVGLAFIFRQNVESRGEYLFNAAALSDAELAMMEAAFADAGLEHGRRDGSRIRVPAGEVSKYMKALSDAGALPETSRTAYDRMFDKSNLMDPRHVLEQRQRQASEQTIERMIRDLAGIQNATVRIEELDKGGIPRRKVRTAVATVKAVGSKQLDRNQVNTIRNIVAAAAGAEREQVTIADSNANLSYPGTNRDGLPQAEEDPYAARVRLYEERTKRSIENMLAIYRGALVEVRAELGRDFVNRVERYTYDARPIDRQRGHAASMAVGDSLSDAATTPPAAITLGNTPRQVQNAAADVSAAMARQDRGGRPEATQTTVQKYGLVPERVTAAIRIPRAIFREIWIEENPPADGVAGVEPDREQLEMIEQRETQAIKDMVTTLLPPPPPGEDRNALVTVLPYTSTPIADPPAASVAGGAGTWFASNWQPIALVLLAVVSLCFLRGMMRSTSARPPAGEEQTAAESDWALDAFAADDLDQLEIRDSLGGAMPAAGRSLRDELTELVQADPDAAANVLANWIGDAA